MINRNLGGLAALLAVLCCGMLSAQGDPDYVFSLTCTTGSPGGQATVRVHFDNPNATENLQGWSYGICNDPTEVTLPPCPTPPDCVGEAQGATVAGFNNGDGPDFYAPAFFPNGLTLGVVVCLTGCQILPPGAGYHFQDLFYDIDPLIAPGTVIPIEFCNTLGNPVTTDTVLVTQSQLQIVPTQIPGKIEIIDQPPYQMSVGSAMDVAQNQVVLIPVTLENPESAEGFSVGISHDGAVVTLLSINEGSVTAATNGGTGPDFFITNEAPDNGPGGTVGCVVSATQEDVIPAGTNEIIVMEYQAAGGGTSTLSLVDTLGTPPVLNLVAVAGTPQVPSTMNGEIAVTGAPVTVFRRGDVNATGSVDISDAVFLANWLFGLGPVGSCEDAADVDDDGVLEGLEDTIFLLNFLFQDGEPIAPFPSCQGDPTDTDTLAACVYNAC